MKQDPSATFPTIDPKEFRAALRARDRMMAFHLFDPNVKLIDVGWRIEEKKKRITDQLTVRAHLRHKPQGEAFETFRSHNQQRVISEEHIGFPVDIVEANYQTHQFWGWPPSPRARVHNPLRGGISISNERHYNYGTLGGIVRDRETNAKMILSNWHVLGGTPYVPDGLKIFQPGYADGGAPPNTIARFKRHAMATGIDAAVAELTDQRKTINDQLGIGAVSGDAVPKLGMRVTKSGRTSEVTNGIITGIEGVRTVPYGGFMQVVRHVIHIAQDSDRRQVSSPGDSGSWWLETSTRLAVGLHFAGSDHPEYGLAISMPKVLEALNVEILTS